jgi:hypothetical protein
MGARKRGGGGLRGSEGRPEGRWRGRRKIVVQRETAERTGIVG